MPIPEISSGQKISMGEAASHFLANLAPEERELSQQELNRFVRWFGMERLLAGVRGPEVANYAERLSLSDTDYARKLELTRAFLVMVKKEGWSKVNLSIHLKAKKRKTKAPPPSRRGQPEAVLLSREGYDKLEAELAALREKRPQLIDEIRKAAADKDFRENVPLQAAREQRGHLEGRISELETALKSAVVIDEKQPATARVNIGDIVTLLDLGSGEECCYTLVSTREIDPARGRISKTSPIGQALVGCIVGEIVEVAAPVGRRSYQIKQVER
ncbi:MAG: transcription elongation factor GreA [Dehalococcoidales bacterium]|nr:transcription elongation factor GreA [Dehalococcoidales bacterium]